MINRDIPAGLADVLNVAPRAQQDNSASVRGGERFLWLPKLIPGITHEINNPVGCLTSNLAVLSEYMEALQGLLGYYDHLTSLAQLDGREEVQCVLADIKREAASSDLKYILQDLPDILQESHESLARITGITHSLDKLIRRKPADCRPVNVNQHIDDVLAVVQGALKHKCRLTKRYGTLPIVQCELQKLDELILYLLLNALNCMETWGEIEIETAPAVEAVMISVAHSRVSAAPTAGSRDSNNPLPEDSSDLSSEAIKVVRDVVADLNGVIEFENVADCWARIVVYLPAQGTSSEPRARKY